MSPNAAAGLLSVVFVAAACTAPVREMPQSASFERIEVFVEENYQRDDFKTRLAAYYERALVPCGYAVREAPCGLEDWEAQFKSSFLVLMHTGHTGLAELQGAYRALESADAISPLYRSQLYESLVKTRNFEQAREFREDLGALGAHWDPLPDTIKVTEDQPGHRYWVVVREGRGIELKRWVPGSEAAILVVSHPSCHFANAAMRDIAEDELLAEHFSRHAVWVTPQDSQLNLARLAAWNSAKPQFRHGILHLASEWPEIPNLSSTPNFYFFRNGELVHHVIGWPSEGRREELMEGLKLSGLAAGERLGNGSLVD